MTRRITTTAVATATTLGWALLVIDAIADPVGDALSRLALAISMTGSIALALRRASRSVAEVYEIGVEAGRRQAKIEAAASRNADVTPFRQRRSG